MPDAPKPPRDRRTNVRRKTLLGGVLVHSDMALTTDCVIRDLSDNGAQVMLPTLTHLTQPTVLLAPSLNRAWEIAVTRQQGMMLGLSFLHEIDLKSTTTEVGRTAYRIWRARGGR